MNRKLKNLNGSPGRARTADLVINSTRLTLFMAQKVEESEVLFQRHHLLMAPTDLRTEPVLTIQR